MRLQLFNVKENEAAMEKAGKKTEKPIDVVALGELLIDFTESGSSKQGNPLLEANPGGAPCNVLSMLSRLGKKTAFIGKVGNDAFGRFLADAVSAQGIMTDGIRYDPRVHTTLAFVTKLPDGDRDFSFYRDPGADINLSHDEVDTEIIRNASVFHFGSLSLTDEPVRSATKFAVQTAQDAGLIISFDPNLREPLWETLDKAKEQIDWGLRQAHILKISDNEITWFTGENDFDDGICFLQENYPNLKLICLSMGPEGSRAYYKDFSVFANAFLQKETIETTGAGDTFCACILNTVLDNGIDRLDEEIIMNMLVTANAAASIVTTRKGALKIMPTYEEVINLISL